MRRLFLLAALCVVGALAFAPVAMAQSTSASSSASFGASCESNGEGGEVCTGLSTEKASALAGEGYSCDQTDNGAVCEGVPAGGPDASATASASADPCPDPDFPRQTPDGCQASDLPDVVFGNTADSTADADEESVTDTAEADEEESATATATAEPVDNLPATGGPSVALMLAPVALLLAGGLVALRVVRRV